MILNKAAKIKKILKNNLEKDYFNKKLPRRNRILKFKDFFKRNQFIYGLAMSWFSPISYNFYYSRKILKYLSKNDIIVNLESGNKIIDPSFINLDLYKYKNVDLTGDIKKLPFKNNCLDGIISEVTLEHLPDPEIAVREISRVLKRGGIFSLSVPFLFYYHQSPQDFQRWTREGMELLLKKNHFKIIEFDNLGGPASVFYLSLSQFLAISLSFDNKFLYHFLTYLFLFIFSPLQILDFIFSQYHSASNSSSIFLIIAKKV